MTFFSKGSIVFVTVNVLRLLSVVAILLALSGEVVLMVSDLKGLKVSENTTSTAITPTSSLATSVRLVRRAQASPQTISDEFGNVATINATPTSSSAATATRAPKKASAATSTTSTDLTSESAAQPSATSSTVAAFATASPSGCAYIGNTSIPKQVGGTLFSTLDRIFCCFILTFALFAELPPPSKFTQRFWSYAFPPFGETFGVGVLGLIQVFVGCSILSHSITNNFALVGGWFVFILGFLNMLFGLAFGARIKDIRSIWSTPTKPSGLRTLHLKQAPSSFYRHNDEEGAYQPQASTVSFAPSTTTKSKNGKNGIVIGAPMMQNPNAPPVYVPGRI